MVCRRGFLLQYWNSLQGAVRLLTFCLFVVQCRRAGAFLYRWRTRGSAISVGFGFALSAEMTQTPAAVATAVALLSRSGLRSHSDAGLPPVLVLDSVQDNVPGVFVQDRLEVIVSINIDAGPAVRSLISWARRRASWSAVVHKWRFRLTSSLSLVGSIPIQIVRRTVSERAEEGPMRCTYAV